ncbi:MAG: GH25 family lysozyme [Frankia sp.]
MTPASPPGRTPGDVVPLGSGEPGAGSAGTVGTTGAIPQNSGAPPNAAPGARNAAAIPSTWPRGIDVASFQHPNDVAINWPAVRNANIRFAFVKATEGTSYTNPYFAADYRDAHSAGIAVGAYHYARPALPISTAVSQATYFVRHADLAPGLGRISPVLDLEATGGLNASQLRSWTLTYLRTIATLTGLKPTLYTFYAFWTNDVSNSTAFTKYPLWLSIWNGASSPGALPGGWSGWRFWQYANNGHIPGISGTVDLDTYCCTFTSFADVTDGRLTELRKRYAATDWLRTTLGPPTAPEAPAGGGGRWEPFAHGLMYWSVETGAREVQGGIAAKYLALNGTNGFLAKPVTDEKDAGAAGTRQSVFQGGRIFWSRATGAFSVRGAILSAYLARGDTASSLGAPVSDQYQVAGGRMSAFQGGYLFWDASTNVVTLIPRT